LRLGAYQLFFTRVPKRAAVAETVEALKSLGVERAAGFANAILRKLSALDALPLPPPDDEATLWSIKESHPRWLVERWTRQWGREKALAVLEADNLNPPVVVRANTLRIQRDALVAELREAGLEATPTSTSPVGVRLGAAGRVEDLFGYAQGLWQVQDEAAQLVVAFAAVPQGARVLDVCAAPGGKSCQLAERGPVLSLDAHANKLEKIRAEAVRLGVEDRVEVRAHDATGPMDEAWGAFDAVLVDAPCSGLGTLRRHPELRYRRKEEDIHRLASLQRDILEHAQAVVKPEGLLVYSVCTTEPEEGVDQMEMFLRSHPDFTSEPPPAALGLSLWQGWLRTLPGPQEMDGFFAARLRKTY